MRPDENDIEYEDGDEELLPRKKKVIPREDQCPEYYEDDYEENNDVTRQERGYYDE